MGRTMKTDPKAERVSQYTEISSSKSFDKIFLNRCIHLGEFPKQTLTADIRRHSLVLFNREFIEKNIKDSTIPDKLWLWFRLCWSRPTNEGAF